jgi:HD-GYP domain-containing protein (c-di-GMP phosphodiesterase class II)
MIEVAPQPVVAVGDAVRTMDRVAEVLQRDGNVACDLVTRPDASLVAAWRTLGPEIGEQKQICVVFAHASVWEGRRESLSAFMSRYDDGTALLVVVGRPREESLKDALHDRLAAVVDHTAGSEGLTLATRRAFELLEAKARTDAAAFSLRGHRDELGELLDIARAMTTVRDVDKLLGVILEKSRIVTGADAGSIYIVDAGHREGQPLLRFKLTQNDSVSFDSREFTMPLSERSIAGSAALRKAALNIPDVRALPPSTPFQFDPSFDRRTGYITRSTIAMPLISQRDEVIGVIQLINKKRDRHQRLTSAADVETLVIPFDRRSEELLGMLAAQAGVSLETAMLYEEIRNLFNGFVTASVEAIESRDPTTSGHSRRVADLTIELAKVVDREEGGPYGAASFTAEELRELEVASLLHDFGKIGVREKVLVKAKKLYDERLQLLRSRFDFVQKSADADALLRKVRLLEACASRDQIEAVDCDLAKRRAELEAAWESVCKANEPSVMTTGDFARIHEIARQTFIDVRGETRTLLDDEELACLSVRRGSLTPPEFDEIRLHVSHTFSHESLGASHCDGSLLLRRRTTSVSMGRDTRAACEPKKFPSSRRS